MKRFITKGIFLCIIGFFVFFNGVFAQAQAQAQAPDPNLITGWGAYTPSGALINSIARAAREGAANAVGNILVDLQKWSLDFVLPVIANTILWLSSWLLWAAVALFNISLNYSLNFGKFLDSMPIIETGWDIFRDIANIGFIFILLYIAISTIVQASTANTKKLLVRVVMIALVLNFSLFFTRVIIDAGNILALSVYQQMGVEGKPITGNPFTDAANGADQGISAAIIKGLALTTIFQLPKDNPDLEGTALAEALVENRTTGINILIIGVAGSIFILVTAFVFLVAAILFLIRTVTLIFLMILSPLAFAANILPQTQKHFSTWFSTLINQTFFPFFFLLLMLMVIQMITNPVWNQQTGGVKSFGDVLKGGSDGIGTLFTFVILIGLMLGSLVVSKQMGAKGGDFARNVAGKTTFGAGAFLGRQIGGRTASNYVNSDQGKLDKNGNILQRGRYNLISKGAAGTWDMRNAGGFGKMAGGLGTTGGTGGFQAQYDAEKKRKTDLRATQTEIQKSTLLDGKKEDLKEALGNKDEAQIEKAVYAFNDSEFAQLKKGELENEAVIRNARPSQISSVLDDKNDNHTYDQKENIRRLRNLPLESALDSSNDSGTDESIHQLTSRYHALSVDERNKIKGDATHGTAGTNTWGAVATALDAKDHAAAKIAFNSLKASNPTAFKELLSTNHHKNIKTQLGKLGTDEKANLPLSKIMANDDFLRHLDDKTLKAIADKKDLSPTEKDGLKAAREGLIVRSIQGGDVGVVKDMMKGMDAEGVAKLANKLEPSEIKKDIFIKQLKVSHMKEMEKHTDEARRIIIGNEIRSSHTSGEKLKYINGKGVDMWS